MQIGSGLSRVNVEGVAGPRIRRALLTRPDLFIIDDKISARGNKAFNVRFTQEAVEFLNDGMSQYAPIGSYHRAVNPMKGEPIEP